MKLLLSMLVLASLAAAQGTDALLTGNVLDSTGAHIPDASVTALNVNTGVTKVVKSNSAGVYLFAALPPGSYRLSADHANFKKLVLEQLTLRVGDHVEQNLTLELGAVSESIQVIADAEAINYLTASQGGTLSSQRIMDLPVSARNVMDFVLTQPGVVGTNFNGARSDMLNISLDGYEYSG